MARSIGAALGILALAALLCACATAYGRKYGMSRADAREGGAPPRLIVVPSTLLVFQDSSINRGFATSVELDAARGEAESAQLLFYAGASAEAGLRYSATALTGPGGATLEPELGIVGYVPLDKPSPYGFHRKGLYPDPIAPPGDFSVPARMNRALWYTVRAPRAAAPGVYSGSVSVAAPDGRSWEVPARVAVRDVALPATSLLKTSVNFRRENYRDPRYYGERWTAEREEGLAYLGLEYRFSHRVDLPLAAVFSARADGSLAADWGAFDAEVERWLNEGITCFELKLDIGLHTPAETIHRDYGARLEEIDRHIADRGWLDLFYFYCFDEPFGRDMGRVAAFLDAVREHAPRIRHVLTYGVTKAGERKLAGRIGMWVPNMHQFDPSFARERKALGEEVWAYACVGNAFRAFPDNFRIDWYGCAHRALGWWLFAYGADGFLYWAVDLWRRDPWKTTATFPWTNGDGVLFYPAPDGESAPYPSIRAHLMRDAFEDFDLLTLLRRAYAADPSPPAEVRSLLEAKGIILGPSAFSTDDEAYVAAHRRVLELLEAARGEAPPSLAAATGRPPRRPPPPRPSRGPRGPGPRTARR